MHFIYYEQWIRNHRRKYIADSLKELDEDDIQILRIIQEQIEAIDPQSYIRTYGSLHPLATNSISTINISWETAKYIFQKSTALRKLLSLLSQANPKQLLLRLPSDHPLPILHITHQQTQKNIYITINNSKAYYSSQVLTTFSIYDFLSFDQVIKYWASHRHPSSNNGGLNTYAPVLLSLQYLISAFSSPSCTSNVPLKRGAPLEKMKSSHNPFAMLCLLVNSISTQSNLLTSEIPKRKALNEGDQPSSLIELTPLAIEHGATSEAVQSHLLFSPVSIEERFKALFFDCIDKDSHRKECALYWDSLRQSVSMKDKSVASALKELNMHCYELMTCKKCEQEPLSEPQEHHDLLPSEPHMWSGFSNCISTGVEAEAEPCPGGGECLFSDTWWVSFEEKGPSHTPVPYNETPALRGVADAPQETFVSDSSPPSGTSSQNGWLNYVLPVSNNEAAVVDNKEESDREERRGGMERGMFLIGDWDMASENDSENLWGPSSPLSVKSPRDAHWQEESMKATIREQQEMIAMLQRQVQLLTEENNELIHSLEQQERKEVRSVMLQCVGGEEEDLAEKAEIERWKEEMWRREVLWREMYAWKKEVHNKHMMVREEVERRRAERCQWDAEEDDRSPVCRSDDDVMSVAAESMLAALHSARGGPRSTSPKSIQPSSNQGECSGTQVAAMGKEEEQRKKETERAEVARKEEPKREAMRRAADEDELTRIEADKIDAARLADPKENQKSLETIARLRIVPPNETTGQKKIRIATMQAECYIRGAVKREKKRLAALAQATMEEAAKKEAEKKEAAKKEAEKKEAAKKEAEKKEAAKKEAEKKEAEKKEAEKKEAAKKEAEKKEAAKKEAEKKEAAKKEAEKKEAARMEESRKEAERQKNKEINRRMIDQREAERLLDPEEDRKSLEKLKRLMIIPPKETPEEKKIRKAEYRDECLRREAANRGSKLVHEKAQQSQKEAQKDVNYGKAALTLANLEKVRKTESYVEAELPIADSFVEEKVSKDILTPVVMREAPNEFPAGDKQQIFVALKNNKEEETQKKEVKVETTTGILESATSRPETSRLDALRSSKIGQLESSISTPPTAVIDPPQSLLNGNNSCNIQAPSDVSSSAERLHTSLSQLPKSCVKRSHGSAPLLCSNGKSTSSASSTPVRARRQIKSPKASGRFLFDGFPTRKSSKASESSGSSSPVADATTLTLSPLNSPNPPFEVCQNGINTAFVEKTPPPVLPSIKTSVAKEISIASPSLVRPCKVSSSPFLGGRAKSPFIVPKIPASPNKFLSIAEIAGSKIMTTSSPPSTLSAVRPKISTGITVPEPLVKKKVNSIPAAYFLFEEFDYCGRTTPSISVPFPLEEDSDFSYCDYSPVKKTPSSSRVPSTQSKKSNITPAAAKKTTVAPITLTVDLKTALPSIRAAISKAPLPPSSSEKEGQNSASLSSSSQSIKSNTVASAKLSPTKNQPSSLVVSSLKKSETQKAPLISTLNPAAKPFVVSTARSTSFSVAPAPPKKASPATPQPKKAPVPSVSPAIPKEKPVEEPETNSRKQLAPSTPERAAKKHLLDTHMSEELPKKKIAGFSPLDSGSLTANNPLDACSFVDKVPLLPGVSLFDFPAPPLVPKISNPFLDTASKDKFNPFATSFVSATSPLPVPPPPFPLYGPMPPQPQVFPAPFPGMIPSPPLSTPPFIPGVTPFVPPLVNSLFTPVIPPNPPTSPPPLSSSTANAPIQSSAKAPSTSSAKKASPCSKKAPPPAKMPLASSRKMPPPKASPLSSRTEIPLPPGKVSALSTGKVPPPQVGKAPSTLSSLQPPVSSQEIQRSLTPIPSLEKRSLTPVPPQTLQPPALGFSSLDATPTSNRPLSPVPRASSSSLLTVASHSSTVAPVSLSPSSYALLLSQWEEQKTQPKTVKSSLWKVNDGEENNWIFTPKTQSAEGTLKKEEKERGEIFGVKWMRQEVSEDFLSSLKESWHFSPDSGKEKTGSKVLGDLPMAPAHLEIAADEMLPNLSPFSSFAPSIWDDKTMAEIDHEIWRSGEIQGREALSTTLLQCTEKGQKDFRLSFDSEGLTAVNSSPFPFDSTSYEELLASLGSSNPK